MCEAQDSGASVLSTRAMRDRRPPSFHVNVTRCVNGYSLSVYAENQPNGGDRNETYVSSFSDVVSVFATITDIFNFAAPAVAAPAVTKEDIETAIKAYKENPYKHDEHDKYDKYDR